MPAGFTREERYLRLNLDPDYSAQEVGYFDDVGAIEAIDDGTSYRKAAKWTPNITRQTLSNIHQDDERRRWYVDEGDIEDDRVATALEHVSGAQ